MTLRLPEVVTLVSTLGRRYQGLLVGTLVLALACSLYIRTLDNEIGLGELTGGDLITHQYAQAELRFSNAPGYPIYDMLGWAWFRGAERLIGTWFNPTEILSMFSTIWSLLTLGLLFRLVFELTKGNALIAGATTFLYMVTSFFWYYSVTTENNSLGVLQTELLIWAAFQWERKRADKYIVLLGFLLGLGLAHLTTIVLAVPALAWLLFSVKPGWWRDFKLLAKSFLAGILPLFSYAYVFVRGLQHPEWRGAGAWPNAWAWFLDFLTTSQGREEITRGMFLGPVPAEMPPIIASELTIIGLVAGLLGVALLGKARGGFLGLIILAYAGFCYLDRWGNWYQVIMPVYLILALGAGYLVHWLDRQKWRAGALATGLLLCVTVYLLFSNFFFSNQRDRVDHRGLDLGQVVLADSPEHSAQILATYEESLSLSYLTRIWGIRPDLKIISELEAPNPSVGPWYVTKSAVQALPVSRLRGYHLSTAGSTLISVATVASIEVPKSAHAALKDFGDQLRLEAYTIQITSPGAFQKGKAGLVNPGANIRLTLFWKALARMEVDYAVSVRPAKGRELLRPAGRLIQEDNRHPVWGNYPTSRWEKGEVVRDDYVLPLPGGLSFDGLMILVYYDTGGGSLRELSTAWIWLGREFETR